MCHVAHGKLTVVLVRRMTQLTTTVSQQRVLAASLPACLTAISAGLACVCHSQYLRILPCLVPYCATQIGCTGYSLAKGFTYLVCQVANNKQSQDMRLLLLLHAMIPT